MATRGRPPQRGEGRGRGEPQVNNNFLLIRKKDIIFVQKLTCSLKRALLKLHIPTLVTVMATVRKAQQVGVLPIAGVLVPAKPLADDQHAVADPPLSTTSAKFSVRKALIRTVLALWIVGHFDDTVML